MLAALPAGKLRDAVLACPAYEGPWLRSDEPNWPPALVGLPGGAVALCAQGNLALLERPAVALVGTRHCTSVGRALAREYAQAVAGAGGVVVSGLAAGIDTEAHIAAKGATIAVLGQGLWAPMPGWQADIRRQVLAAGGLLLSEYPLDHPAGTWTFPRRNRIIAGLARAVVVIEAGHRSGAKNTAHHAIALGRELAVVPALPGIPSFAGCLDLLEVGAAIVRGPDTVVALLAAG